MAGPSLSTKSYSTGIRTTVGLPMPRRRRLPLPTLVELLWAFIGFALTVAGTLSQLAVPDRLPQSLVLDVWPPVITWNFQPGFVFSLQIAAVLLSGCIGGPIAGGLAQIAYLSVGLTGLAVFADGGGLGYLNHPQAGYLLAFIPAAVLTGHLAFRCRSSLRWLTVSALAGLVVIHGGGLLGLLLRVPFGSELFEAVVHFSVLPLLGQAISVPLAAFSGWVVRRLLLS